MPCLIEADTSHVYHVPTYTSIALEDASYMLPFLFLKARHLCGSTFCGFHRLGVPEQALGGILVLIFVEDKNF